MTVSLASLAACGGPIDADAGCPDGSPRWVCAMLSDASTMDVPPGSSDAATLDAATPDASTGTDYVPYLAGDYYRAFVPNGTNYLNDHTLVHDPVSGWHLIGITFSGLGNPSSERELLHATAPSVLGPWTQDVPALTARADLDEAILWAPYVFPTSATRWTMLYEAGTTMSQPWPERELRRADSADLQTWTRQEAGGADPAHRVPGGRDPFAIRIGDEWWIYSVGVRGAGSDFFGQILMTRIANLDDPAEVAAATTSVVIEDPMSMPEIPWGNLESPFVVFYGGKYYLFVTRTGTSQTDYVRTVVFRSEDPSHFEWDAITEIISHAAEIVQDGDRWYITSAGWTANVGEANRGLLIAPLRWARQ